MRTSLHHHWVMAWPLILTKKPPWWWPLLGTSLPCFKGNYLNVLLFWWQVILTWCVLSNDHGQTHCDCHFRLIVGPDFIGLHASLWMLWIRNRGKDTRSIKFVVGWLQKGSCSLTSHALTTRLKKSKIAPYQKKNRANVAQKGHSAGVWLLVQEMASFTGVLYRRTVLSLYVT
jgi:hypothetical protein